MESTEMLKLKIKQAKDEQIELLKHNAVLRAKIIETLQTKVSARDKRIAQLEQEVENLDGQILEMGEFDA